MDINECLKDNMRMFTLHAPYGFVYNKKGMPTKRKTPKVGRNKLCPCGSGRKFKACCLGKKTDSAN